MFKTNSLSSKPRSATQGMMHHDQSALSATTETPLMQRQILLVGPYGVLGTGVIDAVRENPKWGVTTAARRPAPAYRAQSAPPHIRVDLMDHEVLRRAPFPLLLR